MADARECDIVGRESTVRKWVQERDQEWLTKQVAGVQEPVSQKDRRAILIAVNHYADSRIRDLNHSLETVRELGVVLEQLNFVCEYLHDDLPEDFLPTTMNIERVITAARRRDEVLVVYFVGHAVHGSLAPPRSSPLMRFVAASNTSLDFTPDCIITLEQIWEWMTVDTIDANDHAFDRKGIMVIDGSYMGPTYESASMGFAYIRGSNGSEFGVEYGRKQQILLSLAFRRAMEGKVNVNGQIPSHNVLLYCQRKMHKAELREYCFQLADPTTDFPLSNRLLRPKHELAAVKEAKKEQPCSFTMTFTVYHDLDVHNSILMKIISNRLIDVCGQGVEVGKPELLGVCDIVLDGKIESAMRPEKQKLWRNAVDSFAGTPGLPYTLIFSDSTRLGDEGRHAVICSVETDNEALIDLMRTKFAHLSHFFGQTCLDFRQHMQVTLQGTRHQYERFNNVARRGGLDDSIFQFIGLHRAMHNVDRFNVVDDEKLAQLVLDGVALLIVTSENSKTITKRNQALGRVAALEHFRGKIRFFLYDIPRTRTAPNLALLPGPDIGGHLAASCVLLVDIRQGRSYVMLPSKTFFQGGFFPDSDIREFCEVFLEGKLQTLNHRVAGANNHPRYRLL
eukprot:GGOE01010079.1.p1 GENE.GGOE01010079.1~~GGOE01010079.1.p1  ORF type:complete len:724 (+),score=289.64 GGOE01010079.1:311-2173(+)